MSYNTLYLLHELYIYVLHGVFFGVLTTILIDKIITLDSINIRFITKYDRDLLILRLKENVFYCAHCGFVYIISTDIHIIGTFIGCILKYVSYISMISMFYSIIWAWCKNMNYMQMKEKVKYIKIYVSLIHTVIFMCDLYLIKKNYISYDSLHEFRRMLGI
jgi:hypothetical protein